MKNAGAVLTAQDGPFEIMEWPLDAGSEDVVLQVELTGLCGSDLHVYRGEWVGARYPLLLGHENVGTVVQLPTGQADVLGQPLHIGDRVVMTTAYFGECGRCYDCSELAAPWACRYRKAASIQADGHEIGLFGGGLARYLVLSPPESRMLLKTSVSANAAVLHEPLSVAVQMAMGGPRLLGSEVAVQGTGAIGLLTVALARMGGASTVIAVGGPPERLKLARELGADVTIDIADVPDAEQRAGMVREHTVGGRGVDASYEIAGVASAVAEGLSYLKPSGVLLEAGAAADIGPAQFNPHLDLQRWRRQIVGVRGRGLRDFTIAGRLLERLGDRIEPLVSHRIPITRVEEGLRSLSGRYSLDGTPVTKVTVEPPSV